MSVFAAFPPITRPTLSDRPPANRPPVYRPPAGNGNGFKKKKYGSRSKKSSEKLVKKSNKIGKGKGTGGRSKIDSQNYYYGIGFVPLPPKEKKVTSNNGGIDSQDYLSGIGYIQPSEDISTGTIWQGQRFEGKEDDGEQ
jgi:hypothetical protein